MKTNLIYLAEDDYLYATIVTSFLKKKGYTNIVHFDNGSACVDNLYKLPSMVILDYQLGEENGLDVLKKIKGYDPDIHVVFLSGQKKLNVAIDSLKYE